MSVPDLALLWDLSADECRDRLEDQFKTNVFGVANLTRAIMPYFRKQKSGYIVLISSSATWLSTPAFGAYVGSKCGVEGAMPFSFPVRCARTYRRG